MSSSKECYVPGGRCYCDSVCTTYNDCCDDVNASILSYRKFMMILDLSATHVLHSLINKGAQQYVKKILKHKMRVRMCFLPIHSAQYHFQYSIILLLTDSGHIVTAIQGKRPNESYTKKQRKILLCLQQYGSCCSDTERKTQRERQNSRKFS